MCTTGALRLADDEWLLFKNKDFGRRRFDDLTVVEPDVFGVAGAVTWADDDPGADRFSGMSVGANRHGLLCGDTNVRTVDGMVNYDDAVEIALRRACGVDDAIGILRRAAAEHPFMPGNVVMIDGERIAVLELRGDRVEVEYGGDRIVRTNHQLIIGRHPDDDDRGSSGPRLTAAGRRLNEASSLGDVFEMLSAHDDGDTGICNHGDMQTVYSYLIHRRPGRITLHVLRGHPCESASWGMLDLPLGAAWSVEAAEAFRAEYPSERDRGASAG